MPIPSRDGHLTVYRSPPSEDSVSDGVVVFVTIRDDQTNEALPKPVAISQASMALDDATTVAGDLELDATASYHVRFRVPKSSLTPDGDGID